MTDEKLTRARVRELRNTIGAQVEHAAAHVGPATIGLTTREAESVVAALGVLLVLPERTLEPRLEHSGPEPSLAQLVRAQNRIGQLHRDRSYVNPLTDEHMATIGHVLGVASAMHIAAGERIDGAADEAIERDYQANLGRARAWCATPARAVVNVRALLAALLERIPLPELGRVIENIAGGDVERLGQKIEVATSCHDGVRACLDEMAARLLGGAST